MFSTRPDSCSCSSELDDVGVKQLSARPTSHTGPGTHRLQILIAEVVEVGVKQLSVANRHAIAGRLPVCRNGPLIDAQLAARSRLPKGLLLLLRRRRLLCLLGVDEHLWTHRRVQDVCRVVRLLEPTPHRLQPRRLRSKTV